MKMLARLIQDWRADAAFNPRETNPGYAHALEKCAAELEALIPAVEAERDRRCPVLWAHFNQCVRPVGHQESHLTDRGADWTTP